MDTDAARRHLEAHVEATTMKKSLRNLSTLPVQYRSVDAAAQVMERGEGESDKPAVYDVVMSTEVEVERWWGIEILDHSKAAVDLSRMKNGAAVLVDHYSDQVGVVADGTARVTDERMLRGGLQFSRNTRGQEVERDVQDRVRRHVSIGYRILKAKLVENRDGVDVWRITRWQPMEVSVVSIPADTGAGFGRSAEKDSPEYPVEVEVADDDVAVDNAARAGGASEEGSEMFQRSIKLNAAAGGGAAAPAVVTGDDAADKAELQRADGIRALCDTNGIPGHVARELVGSVLSLQQVQARIAQAKATQGEASTGAVDPLAAVPEKERSAFSYHRAIRQYVLEHSGEGKLDGVEAGVHEELLRQYPFKSRGGLMLPMRTRSTLATGVTGKGAELVPTQLGELIEVLRARTIALQAGARLLTGLNGPVGFPKVAAGGAVTWVAENPANDVGDSDPTLGIALLDPKTMMGNIPFTRQLLMQAANIDIEQWCREELATYHGLALDRAFFHGLGAAGEPTGIYKTSGVNVKAFASTVPDLPGLMSMVTAIADKNADLATMRFVTTPSMAGKLRTTQEFSGTNGVPIWTGNLREGLVLGYAAMASTQLSSVMTGSEVTGGSAQGLVFGNFADAYIALFGAMELVVDPYTKKKKGIVEVTSFQMGDTMARHGESFTKGTDALAA